MLDWLKETEIATRLESAVARVIAEGKVRTYDMGGKHPRSKWPRPSPITPVRKITRPTSFHPDNGMMLKMCHYSKTCVSRVKVALSY